MSNKINKPALIEVLQHIQSRTDCILINLDVYKPSRTGEHIVQKIENKAFEVWMGIKDNKAKDLTEHEILEAKDLYQLISIATSTMDLGSDMTSSEVSSWKWELEQALYGKTHDEILHGYMEKFIPVRGKIIDAEEVPEPKPKTSKKKRG